MSTRKRLSRREQEEERRMQRKRFWIGIFVMVVMVLGSVGFIATSIGSGGSQGTNGYGFEYRVQDNLYVVQTSQGEVPFYSLPQGLQVSDDIRQLLQGSSDITLAFNASEEDSIQFIELVRFDLSNYLVQPTSSALLEENSTYGFPVVSCEQASPQSPIIIIRESPSPTVELINDSCVQVSGLQTGVLFARDALLYEYFELV